MKTVITSAKYFLFCAAAASAILLVQGPMAHAQQQGTPGCDGATFLGFPAWYRGLTGADCEIASPESVGGIGPFIWIIVLNIIEIILRAAGYAAVAFIIYGGFKYMTSTGSPDGMVSARKTIMNAVIGLVISVVVIAVVNTISNNLGIKN